MKVQKWQTRSGGDFCFKQTQFGGIFQQQSIRAPDEKVEKYEIVERLLPLKMSSEHISVGCFGDGNSAEYFNFKTVAFMSEGCEVLVAHL